MAWFKRATDTQTASEAVRAVIEPLPGERLVASATDAAGTTVVVGTARLYAVGPDGIVLRRPWHLVDAGSWNHDEFTLTVTWVDGARPQQWVLHEGGAVLSAFRERVQASVVLSEDAYVGTRRCGRVVIRKDLADGSLHDQTILARGVRLRDPGVEESTSATRAYLREQVGLD